MPYRIDSFILNEIILLTQILILLNHLCRFKAIIKCRLSHPSRFPQDLEIHMALNNHQISRKLRGLSFMQHHSLVCKVTSNNKSDQSSNQQS
jgi:hypothetical protein